MNEQIERIKEKIEEQLTEGDDYNLPMDLEEVEAFEEELGIELPKEVKLFYTMVCNGGCLSWSDNIDILEFEELEFSDDFIGEEFPYTSGVVWEDFTEEEMKEIKVEYGNIAFMDIGCGETFNIIINGKEKGEVWNFTEVGIAPLAPRSSFLDFIEYILDGGRDFYRDSEYVASED